MTLDWKKCKRCKGYFNDIIINCDICSKCKRESIDQKEEMSIKNDKK